VDVKTSQRAFVGVTLTTLLGVASVLVVYATLLGTLTGGNVVVGGFGGSVYYSLSYVDTLPQWAGTLDVPNTSTSWYAKINTTAGGYTGKATIKFQLQKTTDGGVTWTDVNPATTITGFQLDGNVQQIYASSNGTFAGTATDWKSLATSAATYHIVVTVNT